MHAQEVAQKVLVPQEHASGKKKLKMSMWNEYEGTCTTSNEKAVSYRKFLRLWDEFYPDVVVAKPMTDVCLTCQQNTTKLQRAAHLSDEEKSECVKAYQEHLNTVQTERECYRNLCNDCEKIIQTLDTGTLENSMLIFMLTKTIFFLWYLAYRILLKLHHSITYLFLIAGHTKFGPNRCFGLVKKVYNVTYTSSLYEFARFVDTSSNSGLNKVQLVERTMAESSYLFMTGLPSLASIS